MTPSLHLFTVDHLKDRGRVRRSMWDCSTACYTAQSCPVHQQISDRHMSPWSCWHTKGRGRRGLMMSLRGALHHWWINVLESDASWLFFKSAQQRWPLLVLLCVWVKTFACRESQSCVVVSLELWRGFQHWTSLCFRWHYWTTRCCLGRLFFPSPFKWKKKNMRKKHINSSDSLFEVHGVLQ